MPISEGLFLLLTSLLGEGKSIQGSKLPCYFGISVAWYFGSKVANYQGSKIIKVIK
jgi:hypothetical protein